MRRSILTLLLFANAACGLDRDDLCTEYSSGRLTVRPAPGFEVVTTLALPVWSNEVRYITVGDLDGNEVQDIVVVTQDDVLWYRGGLPSPSFGAPVSLGIPDATTQPPVLRDIDGDGRDELILLLSGGVYVVRGETPAVVEALLPRASAQTFAVANDGALMLAGYDNALYEPNDGQLELVETFPLGTASRAINLDLDGVPPTDFLISGDSGALAVSRTASSRRVTTLAESYAAVTLATELASRTLVTVPVDGYWSGSNELWIRRPQPRDFGVASAWSLGEQRIEGLDAAKFSDDPSETLVLHYEDYSVAARIDAEGALSYLGRIGTQSPRPGAATARAIADIDGDGNDEFIATGPDRTLEVLGASDLDSATTCAARATVVPAGSAIDFGE